MAAQSVLFSRTESPKAVNRGRGWSVRDAKQWLFDHGFSNATTDAGPGFLRFRQFDPTQLVDGTVETTKVGFPRGVQAVAGQRNR